MLPNWNIITFCISLAAAGASHWLFIRQEIKEVSERKYYYLTNLPEPEDVVVHQSKQLDNVVLDFNSQGELLGFEYSEEDVL